MEHLKLKIMLGFVFSPLVISADKAVLFQYFLLQEIKTLERFAKGEYESLYFLFDPNANYPPVFNFLHIERKLGKIPPQTKIWVLRPKNADNEGVWSIYGFWDNVIKFSVRQSPYCQGYANNLGLDERFYA